VRFKLKILMLGRGVDVKWSIGWGDGVGEGGVRRVSTCGRLTHRVGREGGEVRV